MKLSDYIEKYGDCEVTDEIDKCIVKAPKTVYDLKYGDIYFFLTASGISQGGTLNGDGTGLARRSIGNMFLTIEDAEFAKERLKVLTELKKYAKEFSNEEWKNGSLSKYSIRYDCQDFRVCASCCFLSKGAEIYFENMQKAQEAIKAVGEDRIKKYYLGVEE